ncbi:helix-turn-helix domain-containing protein [Schleiferilactobacillus perolens]|nr:XRE family transcriptional regulator [Schleiferilactobacillus perolens]
MIGSVLKEMREEMGIGVNQLASRSGVSASQISRIENQLQNSPTVETIQKLSVALRDNGGRLITASLAEGMSPYNSKRIDTLAPVVNGHSAINTEMVRVYETIHTGNPAWTDEDIIGELAVPPELVKKYGRDHLFAITVKGESVDRRIPNGHVAVFSRNHEIKNGSIVAVHIGDADAVVRVFEKTSQAIIFMPDSWLSGFRSYIYRKDSDQNFRILGEYIYSTDYPI